MIDGSTGKYECECGECKEEINEDDFETLFQLKDEWEGMETFIQKKKHSPKDMYSWLEESGELCLAMSIDIEHQELPECFLDYQTKGK